LQQERLVLPGDSFQTQCVYNTMDRQGNTYMGLSTQDEMCLAYVIYYPRIENITGEACMYGNYVGTTGQTIRCGMTITNWQGPTPSTPYIAPPCNYLAPPSNNTRPVLVHSLDKTKYVNNLTLDEDGLYRLYWAIVVENLVFHVAVEVKTGGWVGLGISPAGMDGADVFIAWVKDGQVHFADRFATQKALPGVDALQDAFDISAGEISTSSDDNNSDDSVLSKQALIGVTVVGSILFIGIALILYTCFKRKNNPIDKSNLLTSDTYGGVRSDGDEEQIEGKPNKKTPASVPL